MIYHLLRLVFYYNNLSQNRVLLIIIVIVICDVLNLSTRITESNGNILNIFLQYVSDDSHINDNYYDKKFHEY